MESILLNGKWKLYYHPENGKLPETPAELLSAGWDCIDAQVPGNIELDLYRAGLEDDPFFGENLYKFRKYEFYQWWFVRDFDVPAEFKGKKCVLDFEGIDTFADVFVNGVKVGETDNMFIEHLMNASDALRYGETNQIAVRIRSTVNEARKKDYPIALIGCGDSDEYTQVRKPSSCFGWDILGRFVSAGMWRDVKLCVVPEHRFTQVYVATKRIGSTGNAHLQFRMRFETSDYMLDGFSIRMEGRCGDSYFCKEVISMFVSLTMTINVPSPKLWWPLGYGEQPLYDIKVTLLRHGVPVDVYTTRIGIRELILDTKWEAGDAGEFRILCNGCPILAKGSNWVPMDALHSRDKDKVASALALFKESGCNIVRCWGGNVYEDHNFFDLCDEYGIMVWQDFAMACAVYSPYPEFSQMITREATAVIRKLRNHPSILLWAGDNEVDEGLTEKNYPTYSNRYNEITREILPRVVRMEDPYRVFLPSSPYIPEGIARYDVPEQHNWGPRAYFKDDFYKHTKAHFISECGYHGCPSPESLKKYIPEEELSDWLGSNAWYAHSTDYAARGRRGLNRIKLMHDQVVMFFGEEPTDLARFSKLSQIVQAEAKKFFIERTRLKKWRRTGIIWWNMIDGWPQISDAVVDYYYDKKLAFEYIKRVQRPVCLMVDEMEGWSHDIVLGNDSRETFEVTYCVTDGESGEVIKSGSITSPANTNVKLGSFRQMCGNQRLILLRYEVNGVKYVNHYITGYPQFDPDRMLKWVEIIKNAE